MGSTKGDLRKEIVKIVFDLVDSYLNKRCKVYMDNWYNSPKSFLKLLERKTQAAETVRLNRKGMPRELAVTEKRKKGEHTLPILVIKCWIIMAT